MITPPPELVAQWADMLSHRSDHDVFAQAAQWGANQELEACCEWLVRNYNYPEAGNPLRAARRPKPPSLKEQALIHFESHAATFETAGGDSDLIRRALEALPNG
jgi:hypothetical protein